MLSPYRINLTLLFALKKRSGYIKGPVKVHLQIIIKGKRIEIATQHKVDPA